MIFDFDRKDTIQNELYLIINKYKTNTGHYHSYRTYKIEDEDTGEIEKCTIKLEAELDLYFKENLLSGTYKLIVSLYDGENYIGEVYQYIIIK